MEAVVFQASDRVVRAVESLERCRMEESEVASVRAALPLISLASAQRLVAIFRRLAADGDCSSSERPAIDGWQLRVDELLRGCEFVPRALPPKPVDPAVQATLERLRAEASNREYAKMVANLAVNKNQQRRLDRVELRDMGHSVGVGVNILVTMATMFTIGYFTCSFAFASRVWGIVGGLCLMVIGLLAEGSLFVLGTYQIDKHMQKQQQRAQRSLGRTRAFPPPPPPLTSTPTSPITSVTKSSRVPGSLPKSVWRPKVKEQ